MKQLIAGLAVGAAVVGGVWFFTGAEQAVAVVGDTKITQETFYNKLQQAQGENVLRKLIDDEVIKIHGKELGIEVTDDEITAELDKLVQDRFQGDKAQLESALKESDMSMDQLKEEIRTSLTLKKIATKDVTISDQEIKDYYEKNKDAMGEPEEVHARHILVKDDALAKDLVAQLKADPSKFEALAKEHSQDPSNADKGGDLGYFGKGAMVPDFEKAAFEANVNDIVGPVKTEFGYHIIQVVDHKEAKVPTLDEKKKEIEEQLKTEKAKPFQELMNELHAKTAITINDKKYDTILNPPMPQDPTQAQ